MIRGCLYEDKPILLALHKLGEIGVKATANFIPNFARGSCKYIYRSKIDFLDLFLLPEFK